MAADPFLNWTATGERLDIIAGGGWTAGNADLAERLVDSVVLRPATQITIDLGRIQDLDVFGAWLVERLRRKALHQQQDTEVLGVSDRHRGLLEGIRRTNHESLPVRDDARRGLTWLETIGRGTADASADLVSLIEVLGALGSAFGRVLLRPARFRLISAVHHLDRVGLQGVPIILLITFLIGCIISQQGIFHFRKFGAEDYVVDLVGILILREIGILIVAIMVAGRSGSSYTAELGSMKMREEIDALRTMGLDPVEVLMLPRILALVCALPALTFLGSIAALFGGGLVAWLYGGLDPAIFISRLKDAVAIEDFQVGLIKAPIMALAIGAVACSEGMRVKGSAESLGMQTTTSVVKAIFLVIVLDGFFAIFFASIGM